MSHPEVEAILYKYGFKRVEESECYVEYIYHPNNVVFRINTVSYVGGTYNIFILNCSSNNNIQCRYCDLSFIEYMAIYSSISCIDIMVAILSVDEVKNFKDVGYVRGVIDITNDREITYFW
jgi:hypothetical protein